MGQSWSASTRSETICPVTCDKDNTLEDDTHTLSSALEVEFETQREMKINDHSYLGDSFMLCEPPIVSPPDTSIVLDNKTLSSVKDMTDHSCTSTCPSITANPNINTSTNITMLGTSVDERSTTQVLLEDANVESQVQDSKPVDAARVECTPTNVLTVHEKLDNSIPTLDSLFHYYTVAGVPRPTHPPQRNNIPAVCASTLENLQPKFISTTTTTTPTLTKTCTQTQQRRRRGKQTNKITLVGFPSSQSALEVAHTAKSPFAHDHPNKSF